MSELPVPAPPPDASGPRIAADVLDDLKALSQVCANCHAPLTGEYCAACGQRHEPHIHTVAHFAGEAFESISHADSRLWRTLWYLFSRPGFLTREFFAGRRVAYLPPFRLYLVMSVLFFSVIGIGGGDVTVNVDKPLSAADAAELRAAADQIEQNLMGPGTEQQSKALADLLRSEAAQQVPAEGAAAAGEPGTAADKDPGVNMMTGEGVQSGIRKFCEDFRSSVAGDRLADTVKQRSVMRWCNRYDNEGFSVVGEALLHNLPKAMFIFLPLLALCMKLIYWRPKHYYVEHLLFLVHNHTLVFLVLGLCMLVGMIPLVGDYAWILYWAAFIYLAWYIYRALRRVYGQGRWLTVLKYFGLGTAYLFAGFTIFLLTLIYSALTF